MKKLVMSVVLIGLVLSSGCSMLNYSASKKDYTTRVAMQRAMASGDQNVVKAVAAGNYVGLGVDLLDPNLLDVLAEHPVRAVLAGLADVGTVAGGTWALTRNSSKTSSMTVSISGNNNAMNYNNGNGNSNSGTTTPGNNSGNTNPEATTP